MKYLRDLQRSIATIVIAAFFISGCGTIFKGSKADVRVNSSPSGADVYINDIDRGATPQTLSLNRNKNYVLEFRKDGYESVNIEVNKDFDFATAIIGNIFSWGLVGMVVDLASGSAYSLEPADVQANLGELNAAGLLPDKSEMENSDIHVIMVTKKQWDQISK